MMVQATPLWGGIPAQARWATLGPSQVLSIWRTRSLLCWIFSHLADPLQITCDWSKGRIVIWDVSGAGPKLEGGIGGSLPR